MPVRSAQLVLLDTRATPGTRGECREASRPCQYTQCREHLWVVDERPGRRWVKGQRQWTKVTAHHGDTCALDCAESAELEGESGVHMTFAEIGKRLGVVRERVRQIHDGAIEKLKDIRRRTVLHLEITHCDECPCKTAAGCEYPGAPRRDVPDAGVPEWCPVRSHPLLMGLSVAGGKVPEALDGVRAWQEALEEQETW